MKILAIAPTPYFADRGCHVQIRGEARALAARGHDVRIVTYGHGDDPGDVPLARIARIPGYAKVSAGPSPWKALADPMLAALAVREARNFRPDVVHAHLHEGAAIALLVRQATGIPFAAEFQGSLAAELAHHGWRAAADMARPVEAFLVRAAGAVVAQTEDFAGALVRRQGADPARVFVAGPGVDASAFSPGPPPADLAARLELPDPEKVVLYLGHLSAYQGVDLFLAAAARVAREAPETRFLVMGYPRVGEYREMARRLGIGPAVRFTGRVDYAEAPRHLRLGRIAVSAKRDVTEGNGKLADYLAAGLGVVTTGTPGHREIAGDAAVYVPQDDAAGLAGAILGLLRDAPRREGLGRAGRDRAVARLSWDAVAARLERAFAAAIFSRG